MGEGAIRQISMYGEKTLMPYLLDRKIAVIDYMIISHFDTDHVRTDCFM